MREWKRAAVPMLCGACPRVIARGDPVLVIEFTYRPEGETLREILGAGPQRIKRVRCEKCEGPAPPDLPPYVERGNAITPRPLARVRPVLPFGSPLADWRARQSNDDDREPGEEG